VLILQFELSHSLQMFDRFTVKHAFQNTQNDCHQWLSDSSKQHQTCYRPGLRPRPRWGSLQCSPRLPSWLKGPYFLERGRRGGDTPISRPTFLNVPTPLDTLWYTNPNSDIQLNLPHGTTTEQVSEAIRQCIRRPRSLDRLICRRWVRYIFIFIHHNGSEKYIKLQKRNEAN